MAGQGIKQVFNTALTANDSTAKDEVGILRYESTANGQKVYKYILAGTAIANGDNLTVSGVTGYTLSKSTGVTRRLKVVAIGQSTITNTYYGWVLISGYHSAIKKTLTAASVAGVGTYEVSGKLAPVPAMAASGKFSSLPFIQTIVLLSAKACACTASPGIIMCM